MEFFFGMVTIGVIAWLVLRSRGTGPASGTPRTPTRPQQQKAATPHQLHGAPIRVGSRGRVPVVGESHYQPAIATVVAGRDVPDGGRWDEALEAEAVLVPEPSNPYDSNAVRIDLTTADGWVTVGYLSRDIARDYQSVLLTMTREGGLPSAPARICRSSGGPMAVYLHLSGHEDLAFHNSLPASATALPATSSCAISGENRHQENLERYRSQAEVGAGVWATLHPTQVSSGKHAGTPTLEVRLDGERVGELTAAQAERYSNLVFAPGLACEAEVYSGSKNLEVRVFLPAVQ